MFPGSPKNPEDELPLDEEKVTASLTEAAETLRLPVDGVAVYPPATLRTVNE